MHVFRLFTGKYILNKNRTMLSVQIFILENHLFLKFYRYGHNVIPTILLCRGGQPFGISEPL